MVIQEHLVKTLILAVTLLAKEQVFYYGLLLKIQLLKLHTVTYIITLVEIAV